MEDSRVLLAPLRFLDLTDEKGFLCGRVLGDLGADVIKVERPGGDPDRNRAPFYQDTPHPEKSLPYLAFNASKRGITLNIEHPRGRELLRRLTAQSDGLIESLPPGYLEGLGLGYEELSQVNPGLIFTSISPFGQSGPYRDYKASDLVIMALSGVMSLTGEAERPPVRFCLDQSYYLASAHAAAATMIAYYNRQLTGQGQAVDVSLYECLVRTNYREPVRWEYDHQILKRSGPFFTRGRVKTRLLWRCRDGYVSWVFFGGQIGARENRALVAWMEERGMAGPLSGVDWEQVDLTTLSQEQWQEWEEVLARFFSGLGQEELWRGALDRGVRLCPLKDLEEVWREPQFLRRGFWVDLEHPQLGRPVTLPGQLFLSTEVQARAHRPAPRIGEHNQEVYGELLSLSPGEIEELKKERVI